MQPLRTIAVPLVFLMVVATAAPAGAASGWGEPTIDFAGYTWDVKHSDDQYVGPGPNIFTNDNVKVDRKGRLHLRIDQDGGVWRSSEVILDQALGYGTYQFTVHSSLNNLDPNVVLGLFTWSDLPEQHNREIDIEFSEWGNPSNPFNAGYTVQPYDTPGNQHPWRIKGQRRTTHEFTWTADKIEFRSLDRRGRVLAAWTFDDASAIPDADTAHARINLWLFRGAAPTDGDPVEIVISDFDFTPA